MKNIKPLLGVLLFIAFLVPATLLVGCLEGEISGVTLKSDEADSLDETDDSLAETEEQEEAEEEEETTDPETGLTEAKVFFSGHSLINLNTPTVFAQFAQSQSLDVSYQLQMGLGSSTMFRLQCPWNGQQADGHAIQYRLQNELIRSRVYDTLVLAENHNIMESIQHSRSASATRVMYDLFTTGNPDGQAYLFENWLTIDNPNIDTFLIRLARERKAWDCVASMVNTTRGSRKAMKVLPASTALAALIVEIRAGRVPGITNAQSLFSDNVHLTHIGNYFISLLQYAVIYQRTPVGLPYSGLNLLQNGPFPVISAATAQRLQEIAWEQAQLAINDTTSHLKTQAQCVNEMQTLCIETYGSGWGCNSSPTRPAVAITLLNETIPVENGAWCRTGPDPY